MHGVYNIHLQGNQQPQKRQHAQCKKGGLQFLLCPPVVQCVGVEIREKVKNKHREKKLQQALQENFHNAFFHNVPASSSRIIYWHTGAGGEQKQCTKKPSSVQHKSIPGLQMCQQRPLRCGCVSSPSLCESNTRCKCDQRTLSHALISIHCEAGKAFFFGDENFMYTKSWILQSNTTVLSLFLPNCSGMVMA